jgi:hypothetical protein
MPRQNWKSWETLLIIGLFSTTAILGLFVFKSKPIREDARRQEVISNLQPKLEKWKSSDYSSLDASDLPEQIKQIKIQNATALNDVQAQQLQETILNYILAYHVGTYEAFHRFRAPVADFSMAGSIVDFVREDLAKSNLTMPSDQEGLFKLYWQKYADANNEWSNFWVGISFTNSSVEVEISTNSIPPLREYVLLKENIGVSGVSPMIDFSITPETILKQNKQVYYATVSLLAKNNDVTCPVYCRFYWSETHQKWLPSEQVTAYSGPRKTTLEF